MSRTPFWLRPSSRPSGSPSSFVWERNIHNLTPLQASCSPACWMSEAASTAWRSCWPTPFRSVAWQPAGTQPSVFRSTTPGTPPQSGNAIPPSETSIPALRNVQRLRTSKSLTCDELNASLTLRSGAATMRLSSYGYVFEASKRSGRTSSPSSRSGSSSQLWSGEHDPIQDFREWTQRLRENDHALYQRMAGMRGDDHALHQRLSQVQR